MPAEPPLEDVEPLSPELVLVADEETARRARERLPLPWAVAATALPHREPPPAAEPEPPPAVVPEPPPAPPVPLAPREPPVPYPRVVLEDVPPPRKRRKRGLVIALVALAALGGAGYATATYWDDTVDASSAPPVQTAPTETGRESPPPATRVPTSAPVTTAAHRPPKTSQGAPRPAPHTARPVTSAHGPTAPPTTAPPAPLPTTTAPAPSSSGPAVRTATVQRRHATTPRPPGPTGSFVPARQWVWAADPLARGYEFTIYRGGRVVFRSRPTAARIQLPRSFRWHAGPYRWTVVPLPSRGGGSAVDSSFVLTAATAAAANRS